MPRDTFFNLPEEKKQKILKAAINEFAAYTYHKASINRIVEKAGIAKGSFYQYFDDKKDLFKYLLQISGEKKLAYLSHALNHMHDLSFFEMIRELYIAGIKFTNEAPELSAIATDFMKNSDSQLKEEILKDNISKSNKFFEELLFQGIQKGEVDPAVDVKLTAFMITSLSIAMGDYFIKEIKAEDPMEMMVLVDKMIYVLKNGLQNKGENF